MAVHASGLLVLIATIYFTYPYNTLFSWHPIFMALGLMGFSLQGIIVYNKYSSLALNSSPNQKYNLHALLQSLAVACLLVGGAVIFRNKSNNNKPHFTSWHGLLGAIFTTSCVFQLVFGFLKSRPLLRRWFKPQKCRKLHAFVGAVIFALGCLVTVLGFRSNWFQSIALVEGIQDQGLRLLIDYVLEFLPLLVAFVVLKQVYDKYINPEQPVNETGAAASRIRAKRSKLSKEIQ